MNFKYRLNYYKDEDGEYSDNPIRVTGFRDSDPRVLKSSKVNLPFGAVVLTTQGAIDQSDFV
ncbi:MAG TPA: hypothetical protein VE467_20805 [Chryseolinea sp.]|nr:hypothetical protein [Chryseolinea sp.]